MEIDTGDASVVQSIHRNYVYIGKVFYDNQIYEDKHEAIIDDEKFKRAQEKLDDNRRKRTLHTRTPGSDILKGILRCGHGNYTMSSSYSVKKQKR